MEKQFVTYEIALSVKELGFNEECLACYSPHLGNGVFELTSKGSSNEKSSFNERFIKAGAVNGCSAPLWQQVIDWLREKHGIIIGFMNVNIHTNLEFMWCISTVEEIELNLPNKSERCFKDYPKAREQAILKAIELCQNKK